MVIGGGVIGCSVAYHLAHEGWTDVVVARARPAHQRYDVARGRADDLLRLHLARPAPASGCTPATSTPGSRPRPGSSTGFKPVGLIEAAADADRLHEYRRVAAFQRHLGLEVEEISPTEMSDLFPWARTDDLLAGFHVPGDGRVNPVDLTQSLARGAKNLGVRVVEGVRGRATC